MGWLRPVLRAMLVWTFPMVTASLAEGPIEITLVTDDNHFPYAYSEDGKPAGLYVAIVDMVIKQMPDYHVTITAVPWRRALHMVENGEADGIFPPHRFFRQRPYLEKFSEPILEEVPIVYCNARALRSYELNGAGNSWPESYRPLVFGVSAGVKMGGDAFWALADSGVLKVTQASGALESIKMLLHGRVDCVINDRFTIQAAMAHLRHAQPDQIIEGVEVEAMPAENSYLAMGHPPPGREAEQQEFLAEFSAILKRMKKSGVISAESTKYLRDIVAIRPALPSAATNPPPP